MYGSFSQNLHVSIKHISIRSSNLHNFNGNGTHTHSLNLCFPIKLVIDREQTSFWLAKEWEVEGTVEMEERNRGGGTEAN